jgi:hypothetical protein
MTLPMALPALVVVVVPVAASELSMHILSLLEEGEEELIEAEQSHWEMPSSRKETGTI